MISAFPRTSQAAAAWAAGLGPQGRAGTAPEGSRKSRDAGGAHRDLGWERSGVGIDVPTIGDFEHHQNTHLLEIVSPIVG